MKSEPMETPLIVGPGKTYVEYQPKGVMCVMGAWNYPFVTLLNPAINVIAAGNCALLKPSEMAPHSAVVIVKLVKGYLDNRYYKAVLGKEKVAVALTSMMFD